MPILLNKDPVSKGSPASFTLDRSSLVSLVSDTYFQDPLNWKKIVLSYVSANGKQKSKVIFDASQENPSSNFLVSDRARDNFEVDAIVIYDFDGGHYTIPRSSLTPAEFDVTIGGLAANFRYYRFTFTSAYSNNGDTPHDLLRIGEIQLKIGGVNTSLFNKPVVHVSGRHGGVDLTSAELTVLRDGNPSTRVHWSELSGYPVSFYFDLQQQQLIEGARLTVGTNDGFGIYAVPKNWTLEGSDNATSWTLVKAFDTPYSRYTQASTGPTSPRAFYLDDTYVSPTPTNVIHTGNTEGFNSTSTSVSWDDIPGVTSYYVQYSFNNGAWTDLSPISTNSIEASWPTEGDYRYRVKTSPLDFPHSPYSEPSAPIAVTLTPLLSPTNLAVASNTPTASDVAIGLTWTAAANASEYRIERSTNPTTTWTQVGVTAGTSFTNTVTAQGDYSYRVRSYSNSRDISSAPSSVVTATATFAASESVFTSATGASSTPFFGSSNTFTIGQAFSPASNITLTGFELPMYKVLTSNATLGMRLIDITGGNTIIATSPTQIVHNDIVTSTDQELAFGQYRWDFNTALVSGNIYRVQLFEISGATANIKVGFSGAGVSTYGYKMYQSNSAQFENLAFNAYGI